MFYKYEIKNNELYLYLTMSYEFSNELNYNSDADLNKITLDFINSNKINFTGNTVNYVVDNIIVKRTNLNNCKVSVINNPNYSCDNYVINLKLDDNSCCEISLHDYLISILFEYYNVNYDVEVLKCICILYSTYAYNCMSNDKMILSNNYFNNFKSLQHYNSIYDNYNSLYKLFDEIIRSVDCMFLSYNNKFILPFIHFSNSGKTMINYKYPYLSSVTSLWDLLAPEHIKVKEYKYENFNNLLKIKCNNKSSFTFINQNNTRKLKIDNNIFSLEELKHILNLNSCDFNFIINNDSIKIISIGTGNGLGLSLFGANEIAKNGGKFQNILKYYFPKVKLLKYIKELS